MACWAVDLSSPDADAWLCCVRPTPRAVPNNNNNKPTVTMELDEDSDIESLINCLDNISGMTSLPSENSASISTIRDMLQSTGFKSLLKIHDKVKTTGTEMPNPVNKNVVKLISEIVNDIRRLSYTPEANELIGMFAGAHFKSVLSAHDLVAQKRFEPELPAIPHEVDEDEVKVKIVRMLKSETEPLGATIKVDEQQNNIHIARVLCGGAADRSGLVNTGDQLHEINGTSVKGKSTDEVIQLLTQTCGPLVLKLTPSDSETSSLNQDRMSVRAQFKFDPQNDPSMPCSQAGLPFEKGEILHIVAQDDSDWWQARKEDGQKRAGLIPSKKLQEKRMLLETDKNCNRKSPKLGVSPKLSRKQKKSRRINFHLNQDENKNDTSLTYEEVSRFQPTSEQLRPLVLCGATGVGCSTLVNRLVQYNDSHFATPVILCNKAKKTSDKASENLAFCSKHNLEKQAVTNQLVEHWEHKSHLYAISLESVHQIVHSGRVCVLGIHLQSLHTIRTKELKPFVIFVRPPPYDKLRESRHNRLIHNDKTWKAPSDEELRHMVAESSQAESQCAHLFDSVITNDDLDLALNKLKRVAQAVEEDACYVPAAWVT